MEKDLVMALLEDIANANRSLLSSALPNFDTKVEVTQYQNEPCVMIRFGRIKEAADYPSIVKAKAVLFPTATRKGMP